jgi:hypothetical protein
MRHHKDIFDKTYGHCWYCGCKLTTGKTARNEFCVDHQIPRARGGTSSPDNLVPCCRRCNSRKGARTVKEYRRFLQCVSIGIEPFTPAQVAWLSKHDFHLAEAIHAEVGRCCWDFYGEVRPWEWPDFTEPEY